MGETCARMPAPIDEEEEWAGGLCVSAHPSRMAHQSNFCFEALNCRGVKARPPLTLAVRVVAEAVAVALENGAEGARER